jgi:hypothetical protein
MLGFGLVTVQHLADQLTLGAVLDELRRTARRYELVDHWQQGVPSRHGAPC